MKKPLLILFISLLYTTCFKSQDIHFSQYNENPLLVNPALAGSNFAMRASIVYRDQWASITTPYRSFGLSFDSRFNASNWKPVDSRRSMTFRKQKHRMAGGISIYNDKAGDSKMGTLILNGTFAMSFPLSKLSGLSFGLQGGLMQRKVDGSKLLYSNQYNGYTYDSSIPSGEHYGQTNFMKGDLAAGVAYTYAREESSIAANDQLNAQIGFSTYHLTSPNQFFLNGSDRLKRKFIFHGNILFGIKNSSIGINPSWLAQMQGPSKEILAGLMIKYYINDNSKYTGIKKRSSIGIGAYYRTGDAIIASVLYEAGRYAIGFSYDINTSKLVNASKGRSAFEITLRFVTPSAYLYQKRNRAQF
jgi:type IX secretion system PorP/SprF family membrane protein